MTDETVAALEALADEQDERYGEFCYVHGEEFQDHECDLDDEPDDDQ